MRKVRALLAAAVLICGLLWIGADVLGADNPEMQVSSGTSEAAPGDEIILTFSLAGYDNIQEGIYALQAALEYDTDIFEAVEEPDFETLSGWEQLRYNAENGQFAVIGMESLPDLYTGISEFRQEKSGAVSAVIDQEDIIRYDADGNRIEGYAFPVAYRDKDGEHPLIKSAQELFDKMADEPKGTFELTEDLDASGIPADAPAIAGTFTGELDGNGHTISGLDAVLFEKTDGASVSNLTIEGTTLTQNTQKGALSNDIRHSVVTDIRGEHFHTVQ